MNLMFTKFFGARKTSAGQIINGPRRPFWFRGTTVVNEDSAMQVAAFNRGLIYISTQIAKLPWDIKDLNNTIVDSPISALLNLAPNEEMNAFLFRLMMVQQAIIHGNSYAEVERNGANVPIALWPLNSSAMDVIRVDGRLTYRYISHDGSREQTFLKPKDVFHIRNFHTKDGIVGQGVVAFGRDVLGIQLAADSMASGLFHNSGIPSGVLTHPGALSDAAYKRLKESWAEQTGGKKSGATSILEEGVKYEAVNMDPEALQFIQSRQFGVLEIARFLGLPPTKLFDVIAAKYSNVENSNLEVATDTLDSWASNFEMEADVKLLNNRYGGRFSDMDLYDIFRGDMTTRANYFKSLIGIGAITPNQIRAREGLAPYKDGDSYYISTNNLTPADRVDDVIDADIEQKTKPAASPAAPAAVPKPQPKDELTEAVVSFLKK